MIGSIQEILFQIAELRRMLAASICHCQVIEVSEKKGRIKVQVDELKTSFIPVLTKKAGASISSFLPEVGEQGLLLSLGGQINQGVYLGSIARLDQSLETSADVHTYKDGSSISYDPDTKKLLVDIKGGVVDILNLGGQLTINAENVNVKGKSINVEALKAVINSSQELNITSTTNISLKAPNIDLNAPVNVKGPLNAGSISAASLGGAAGEGEESKDLKVKGDLILDGLSLKKHTHKYIAPEHPAKPENTGKAE